MHVHDSAVETLVRWKRDPVAFVCDNFAVAPDAWQAEALRAFPQLQEPPR